MAYGSTGGTPAQNPGPFDGSMTDGPMESETPKKEGEDYEGATGILPKSLMAGKDFKVGEEIVLQITRIGESDFEVRYATEKGEGQHAEPHEEGAYGGQERGTKEMGMSSMME